MILPASRPRIFTIPASVDFLPTLARALIDGELVAGFAPRDPLELARATIYLPTRRACRLARDAFLSELNTEAVILPRIVPLGDIDEDEFVFAHNASGAGALDLPPTIGGLQRRALLAQLILKWSASPGVHTGEGAPLVAHSPAAALALADDLARLMDDMTTRQVPWDRLDGLVPDRLDEYWQKSLTFLKIARDAWPAILAERGAIEPAEHRDRLIAAEAERLLTHDGPVIVAGSTGSMPATAKLIATIAELRQGAAVLPGLDTDLDEHSWQLLAGNETSPAVSGHPQFAMQALLARMKVQRSDVIILGPSSPHNRDMLVSEALRPADTTDLWQPRLATLENDEKISDALQDVTVIEAANADEEALAIAITLREVLETPEKAAALVTPDRGLARRVVAALGRWHVVADDSGGDPLGAAPAGVFARLAAEVALGRLEPVPLLALLKHPLLRLGENYNNWRNATWALERAVLHGSRPRPGSAALTSTLVAVRREWEKLKRRERSDIHPSDASALLTADELDSAANLAAALSAALAPLEALVTRGRLPFTTFAAAHARTIEALSDSGGPLCFTGDDGAQLQSMFEDIEGIPAPADMAIAASEYRDMFETAAAAHIVRRPGLPGARVRIYGLLEARLTYADRVVLGGLVEGAWPPQTRNDAWLSRPMRQTLGLDLPERRVGLAAHDFAQLLGAPEVMLTRAAKLSGAPTIASRFAQRLAAVAGARWEDAVARGERYLAMARALDRPERLLPPLQRPAPKPPRAARPKSLSVTEIETWLRDPYSIYAKHILNLRPLEPIDEPPGVRDRGIMIHGAIGAFAEEYKDKLPNDVTATLIELGEQFFAPLKDHPEARAFWWPRFCRIAQWFAAFEAGRRVNLKKLDAEIPGKINVTPDFTLRARADRIEHLADGSFAVLDFKTGRPPTSPQVKSGLSPQLTLEGAILRRGGFTGIPAGGSIAEFMYVSLRGGEPAGEMCAMAWTSTTPDNEADIALQRLTALVERFDDDTTAYFPRISPMFMRRGGGDYDHLARVKEWSIADTDDEESVE